MSDWTDERVEHLKKLWLQGWSASQIAKELGGTTRNAVIGKIHRLNLVARQSPKMTPPATGAAAMGAMAGTSFVKSSRSQFAAIAVKTPAPGRSPYLPPATAFASYGKRGFTAETLPSAEAREEERLVARKTGQAYNPFKSASTGLGQYAKSHSQQCQWPVGDPRSSGFHFCCGGTVEGLPYCPEHARLAYQPTAKNRRVNVGQGDMHATGTPDEREIMVRV